MADDSKQLVWSNGQPMRNAPLNRAVLDKEIAGPTVTGVRSILSAHPAQGLTPARLASLLRAAETGDAISYLELAEEMEEKDLHYNSVLGTRKRAVSQLPIEVVPAGESAEEKADAQLIEDWLDRDTLDAELFDILDAVGKGYSATEIVWAQEDGMWLPSQLITQDPRYFRFDLVDGKTLMLWGDGGQLLPLDPAKFIVHAHPAKTGIPIRGGLARIAAWGWLFKNYAIKDWVTFLENFGMPIRLGRYDNGATEGDIRKLQAAVASLGSDAAATFPKTMDVEFVDAKSGTAPNELWKSLADHIDEQLSKAVLGQTSSSDAKAGGLGSGQANLHNDVRGDIERADAKLLAASLNRDLIPWMIAINRGQRKRYPRLKIGRPDEVDVTAQVENAAKLAGLGVEIDADEMRDRAGLPAPKPGGKILIVSAPQKAPENGAGNESGGILPKKRGPDFLGPLKSPTGANQNDLSDPKRGQRQTAAIDPAAEADPIDAAVDEALGDWERLMVAAIGPVETMISEAASLEQVRDGLAAAIGEMDVAEMTELLARAGFGARLAGEVDIGRTQAE